MKINNIREINCDNVEEYFLGSLSAKNKPLDPWFVMLQICRALVKSNINIRADVSVINRSTDNILRERPTLRPTEVIFKSPGGILSREGIFKTSMTDKGNCYSFDVYLINVRDMENLLERDVAHLMGMVIKIKEDLISGLHCTRHSFS